MFSRLSKNYLILSGAEFISKALVAIAFMYLARVYGPADYGSLEFALAICFIFTLVVESGLGSFGAREIAKQWDDWKQLFAAIVSLRPTLAGISIILMNIIALYPQVSPDSRKLIFYYSLTLLGLPWLCQWIFQGRDEMKVVAIGSLIRWTIFFGGIFLFVGGETTLLVIPVIEGLAIIVTAIFLNSILIVRYGKPAWNIELKQVFSVWKQAIPIGASEFVWALRIFFATLALGFFIGGTELGWFASSHRIIIGLHTFIWLYFYNLLPSIARASRLPFENIEQLIKLSIRISAWVGIYFSILVSAFAAFIVVVFYGKEFIQSSGIFQILIWYLPLAMISGHYRYLLIGFSHQKQEFISSLIGAISIVILNIILIPRLSVSGAALSLVFSELIIWAVSYIMVRKYIKKIAFFAEIWRPVTAGLLMAGLFWALPFSIWMNGFLASIAFGAILILSYPDLISHLRAFASKSALV